MKLENLTNEAWKKTPYIGAYDRDIWVSNFGRVKLVYGEDEQLYKPKTAINKTGMTYYDVMVHLGKKKKKYYRVSRVIYQTFVDSEFSPDYKVDKRVIDHINGDTTDNNLTNLRLCERNGENIKLAMENGKKVGKPKRACYAYNVDTGEYREYDSTIDLVRDIWGSDNPGYFNRYNRSKLVNRDGWACSYDKEELKTRKRKLKSDSARRALVNSKYTPFKIPVYCKETGRVYQSASEAARDTGISAESILKQVKGETKSNNTGKTFVKWECPSK